MCIRDSWENDLRAAGVHVTATDYAADAAWLHVAVADSPAAWADLEQSLAGITAGSGRVERVGEDWVDHDDDLAR